MTEQNHPITPPTELVQKWKDECHKAHEPFLLHVANCSAQWGADQELEACCEWVSEYVPYLPESEDKLRAARRPKSEKQQALEDLDDLEADLAKYGMGFKTTNIRRALESIPNLS
jgi:SNF2 family DNA or RNA helicase